MNSNLFQHGWIRFVLRSCSTSRRWFCLQWSGCKVRYFQMYKYIECFVVYSGVHPLVRGRSNGIIRFANISVCMFSPYKQMYSWVNFQKYFFIRESLLYICIYQVSHCNRNLETTADLSSYNETIIWNMLRKCYSFLKYRLLKLRIEKLLLAIVFCYSVEFY